MSSDDIKSLCAESFFHLASGKVIGPAELPDHVKGYVQGLLREVREKPTQVNNVKPQEFYVFSYHEAFPAYRSILVRGNKGFKTNQTHVLTVPYRKSAFAPLPQKTGPPKPVFSALSLPL